MQAFEHPKPPANMWARVTRVRFFWLLAALVGLILAAPSLPDSIGGEWEAIALGLAIFFAASYVSHGLQRLRVILVLALLLLATIGANILFQDSPASRLILFSVMLVILVQTAINVLSFVLESGQIGPEHIYGAVCAYVLIAMAFAALYFLLETVAPGSFSGVRARALTDRAFWQFFYFSFTTQSTVGYGDIIPVTMRARSFVIIQQLVAVFYVAILIARLTGMYNTAPKPEGDPAQKK